MSKPNTQMMRAVLKDIVAVDPIQYDGEMLDTHSCIYCRTSVDKYNYDPDTVDHKSTCAWRRAKKCIK